ncbi:hypothetical protein [Nitrospira moscoviensis]|nr:hypothetical protein [Nitrospira moscoviensis]
MTTAILRLVAIALALMPLPSKAVDRDKSEQVLAIYPVTSSITHAPDTAISKVVILSAQRNPSAMTAVAAAKDLFRRGGVTVIDKAPPAAITEAQGPPRPDQKPKDNPFLTFGKDIGADHVIVVEVTDALVPNKTGAGHLHDERVSVKGIGVKTGTVALEGTARWSQPIERAGEHVRELTAYAIARAICAPERWVEASAANNGRGRCRS